VKHDNAHAIAFERRLGFVEVERIPLKKRVDGAATFFDEIADATAPADHYFMRMAYAPTRPFTPDGTILTAGPTISGLETSYVLDAARTGWNTKWHGYIGRLERTVAEYFGVKHALSTSSCTGALHLALLGLGIGPGDEVVVPDATWVATANAVAYTGAMPVFVDVEPDSWCMDPASFAAAITSRTKAVMPVHLYGHPARMDEIVRIAEAHDLAVVEDGAPAFGAECGGVKAGTFGDVAAFSFQGAKLAVAGEGGILITDDDGLYARIYALWDQGRDPGRAFWIDRTGWKYKMSNLQAALALAQIERVEELIEAKRQIFQWYVEALDGVAHVTLNHETRWARSIYWMTSIVIGETAPISRDDLRDALKRRGIDTRPVFPAISQYPVWGRPHVPQPIARRLGDRGINLPSGHRLRRDEVAYICAAVRSELGSCTA
jgi:perosamine synthetase